MLAALPLAAGSVAGGWLLLRPESGAAGCTGSVTLTVAVSPTLADPLKDVAAAYRSEHPTAFGYCTSIRVSTLDGGRAAAYLRDGWSGAGAGEMPDVWVPDSADWLALARTTEPANRLLIDPGTVIATSPAVIAMPRPMAEALGWPRQQVSWADLRGHLRDDGYWAAHGNAGWGRFTVALPDPRSSTAGLSALANVVAQALEIPVERLTEKAVTDDITAKGAVLGLERAADLIAGSEAGLLAALRTADIDDPGTAHPSAVPLSESLVYQYNKGVGLGYGLPGGEGPELVASYPADGLVLEEIRYLRLSRATADPVKARMAQDLLALLESGRGRTALVSRGFRPPDGIADSFGTELGLVARPRLGKKPELGPAVLAALQASFVSVHQRGSTLAVLDSSGSMAEGVPGSEGRSRLEVAVEAAGAALSMFADDSRLGLWRFSASLHGDQDWEELVPVGPVSEPVGAVSRTQALLDAMGRIEPGGDTGLYDTALAAFRHMHDHHVDGGPNQVVLLSDGRNSDEGGLSLDELVRTLRREYSPRVPVQIITIAYGEDADLDALARISAATGAPSYRALDPNSIFTVLAGALTAVPG